MLNVAEVRLKSIAVQKKSVLRRTALQEEYQEDCYHE